MRNSVFPMKPGGLAHEHSTHNLSQFYSLNFLEESMSYIERTARKLMPILNEIKKRMVPEKTIKEKVMARGSIANNNRSKIVESLDSVIEDVITEGEISSSDINQENAKKLQ